MIEFVNKKVLVTTSNWFIGPDGNNYRAVWGTLKGVHEAGKMFGFIPNRAHANWFIEVGSMVIMGCQVMYCIQAATPPFFGTVKDHTTEKDIPTQIYDADVPESL